MLYDYIIKNYKETEPIFYSDLPLFGKAKSELSRQLRILCKEGKICKFDKSVYYIPKKSILSPMWLRSINIYPGAERWMVIIQGTRLPIDLVSLRRFQ